MTWGIASPALCSFQGNHHVIQLHSTRPTTPEQPPQIIRATGLTLSGTAIALLAGRESLATGSQAKSPKKDVGILNSALGAELEAFAAYQVGAESGLLEKPVLDLAVQFQGHHKAHAALLASVVDKLGGKAVVAKAMHWAILRNAVGENPVPLAFMA